MFCDDKDSQENAKQIKNQWDKFSKSDKVRVKHIHYIYNIFKVTFELNIFSNSGIDWSVIDQPQFGMFSVSWRSI